MSDEKAIPPEPRNGLLYTGFVLSLLGLLTSIGILRFLVLAALAHDFGPTPIELVAEPLCLAGLVLALRDRDGRGGRLKRLTVIFSVLGLVIALVVTAGIFLADGGAV